MFQNANTLWIEIIAIIAVVGFIATLVGIYAYKKIHHLPTGECACCHKGTKKMLKEYYKLYAHEK